MTIGPPPKGIPLDQPIERKTEYFYDLEFALSTRGTLAYLHRRQQTPRENAIRYAREDLEKKTVLLPTLFMNSSLKTTATHYSPFKHP